MLWWTKMNKRLLLLILIKITTKLDKYISTYEQHVIGKKIFDMNRFNKDYQFSTLPYLHNIIGFIGYFNSFNTPSEYPPINLLLAIFLELSNKAVSFCTSKKLD